MALMSTRPSPASCDTPINSSPSFTRHHNHRSSQSHKISRRSGGSHWTIGDILLAAVACEVFDPRAKVTERLRKKDPRSRRSRARSSEISTLITSTKQTPAWQVVPAFVWLTAGAGMRLCIGIECVLGMDSARYFLQMNRLTSAREALGRSLGAGRFASSASFLFTSLLPPLALKARISCGFHASSLKDFTLLMWAPSERCTPAQSMQMTVP
mmetsp:Transcript_139662/g.260446  ORF Transcript_139662/g.260446 Transcript_139662/m.260446 type:complete len:212 (+) Transcript_139662:902-1537(+)